MHHNTQLLESMVKVVPASPSHPCVFACWTESHLWWFPLSTMLRGPLDIIASQVHSIISLSWQKLPTTICMHNTCSRQRCNLLHPACGTYRTVFVCGAASCISNRIHWPPWETSDTPHFRRMRKGGRVHGIENSVFTCTVRQQPRLHDCSYVQGSLVHQGDSASMPSTRTAEERWLP